MTRARVVALALATLVFALVATNGFWLYTAIDRTATSYGRDANLEDHQQALAQLRAVAPVAARPDATREDVIAAARKSGLDAEPFEKEGFVWVHRIGMRFDEAGRLVEVRPAWQ